MTIKKSLFTFGKGFFIAVADGKAVYVFCEGVRGKPFLP